MGSTKHTIALILAIVMTAASTLANPDEDFREANVLYEEREFDQAIQKYESIVDQGLESPHLYFNLGNAYFKSGDLGHAVLYYLRAKRLEPGDDDISHNLQFASNFTRIQMEGVELHPVKGLLESLLGPYHLTLLAWVSSILFTLFFVLLAIRYGVGYQNSYMKSGIITAFVFLAVFSLLTTFKYHREYVVERAVLIAEDCQIRTGPSDQSDLELEGSPGLVVEVLDESGDWYNVLFKNKRRGWIKKDLVAVV